MGFKKMKTITTLLFPFGIFFVGARAKPPRRVDLYNPNLFEKLSLPKNIEISQDYHSEIALRLTPKKAERLYDPKIVQRLTPKNAERLYDPEILQRLTPKNAERLYDPEIVQRLTPKNVERLYDPEILQRLTPKNAETKKANQTYSQTVATLQIP